jgi:hypothetical protein
MMFASPRLDLEHGGDATCNAVVTEISRNNIEEIFINTVLRGCRSVRAYNVVEPERYFFLHGGGELKSLEELFVELQTMEHETFSHHVTSDRNDFALWVRDVMGDKYLAKNLALAKSRDEMLKMLFMSLFQ